jgi:glutathione S-transferase
MRYLSIAEGRQAPGLRLVLTKGVPGPWGEAAKAIFKVKGLAYQAVAQEGGGENPELQDWTAQAGAPVAVYEDEPPRSESIDILFLAERLAPEPVLIPRDMEQRVMMFGLAREIIGRRGLGWSRRLMMLADMMQQPQPPATVRRLAQRYGYREQLLNTAPFEAARILDYLAVTLARQNARGSQYLVGDGLSAVDIYWACFSVMLSPLPAEHCPMPEWLRANYADIGPVIAASLVPGLLAHRDFIFAEHIGLPLDFLPQ